MLKKLTVVKSDAHFHWLHSAGQRRVDVITAEMPLQPIFPFSPSFNLCNVHSSRDGMSVIRITFGIPVHSAAGNGQKAVVQLFLENGADIEAKNESETTALHWAAGGDHDTVQSSYCGANVEAKDNRGETALHRLLVEKGADFEARTNGGETALQQAAGNGYEVVVRQLLEYKGDDASSKK